MKLKYFHLLFFSGFLFFVISSFAGPVVSVSVDPSRSRNGEPVLLKIGIRNDSRDQVHPPSMPVFVDWEITNVSQAEYPTSVLSNGKIIFRYQGEFTYVLKPLRRGTLKIPSLDIVIGSNKYKTESLMVMVDALPNGHNSRPRIAKQPRSQNPDQEEEDPFGNFGGFGQNLPSSPPPNPREAFFLRAEPSKTNVYQGELIVLSYALYQKDISIANAEISNFQTSKASSKKTFSFLRPLQEFR